MDFRPPRLIVDWDSVEVHHGAHLVSQEAFFSCCFAMLLGGLRGKVCQDHDVGYFIKHFFVLWSLISNAADYATRFNDDDMWHTILWGGYGLGLVATLMFVNDSAGFHGAVACTELWMALAWLRVAVALPRCRTFAACFGCSLVATATLVAWSGIVSSGGLLGGPSTTLLDDFAPPLVNAAASVAVAYGIPRRADIPMNIDYHVPKFAGIGSLVLGQLVGAAGAAPRPGVGPAAPLAFYSSALSAVLLLVSFKLLFSDCDTTLTDNHAIRRSRRAALTWLLACQPLRSLCVALCAAGVSVLLSVENHGSASSSNSPSSSSKKASSSSTPPASSGDEAADFGARLFCYAAAGVFFVALLTERQHQLEEPFRAVPSLRRLRDAWFGALALAAAACAALPSVLGAEAPLILVVATMGVSTACIGLVKKSALLKERKPVGASGQQGEEEDAKKKN